MKKIMAVVMVFVLGLGLLAGCDGNTDSFEQKSYQADGTQIIKLMVDVRDREIEVTPSSDNQIHIDYFESDKESYDISVSNGNEIHMTSVSKKEWTDYVGRKPDAEKRKILVQLPDALLHVLTLSTTNASISLPVLSVQDNISVSANGGNIVFEKLDVGKSLRLDAKNGNITGAILGGYDDYEIECDIKKGESNLPSRKNGGDKSLQVANNNGNIAIEFVKE